MQMKETIKIEIFIKDIMRKPEINKFQNFNSILATSSDRNEFINCFKNMKIFEVSPSSFIILEHIFEFLLSEVWFYMLFYLKFFGLQGINNKEYHNLLEAISLTHQIFYTSASNKIFQKIFLFQKLLHSTKAYSDPKFWLDYLKIKLDLSGADTNYKYPEMAFLNKQCHLIVSYLMHLKECGFEKDFIFLILNESIEYYKIPPKDIEKIQVFAFLSLYLNLIF